MTGARPDMQGRDQPEGRKEKEREEREEEDSK